MAVVGRKGADELSEEANDTRRARLPKITFEHAPDLGGMRQISVTRIRHTSKPRLVQHVTHGTLGVLGVNAGLKPALLQLTTEGVHPGLEVLTLVTEYDALDVGLVGVHT
ncbi:hypothetical protein H257_01458 [Aphanomyces astaci]|uniref:Uncharacterized protein n=1 Tax=Aphanomyces astaci TaxID=112090 RepID=W4H889_APHAT|nr:hypothetical protein H257_01458 [Aphanomyces astaci]ETV88102.1 hypothetical protein H257_01458 [Aphanomyces astaci]|eukprot:XP_009822965.1 hypothetical protein H257_01458 [Aphanomyces astaci]